MFIFVFQFSILFIFIITVSIQPSNYLRDTLSDSYLPLSRLFNLFVEQFTIEFIKGQIEGI